MRPLLFLLSCALALAQSPAPPPDPALEMVEGIKDWLRGALARHPAEPRKPLTQERLAFLVGASDRLADPDLELRHPPLLQRESFTLREAVWQSLEGLTVRGAHAAPASQPRCRAVVAPPDHPALSTWAEQGCEVLGVPVLDRDTRFAVSQVLRRPTGLSHRELIYRMGFPLGRHPLGFDTQAVRAAGRWLAAQEPRLPVWAAGSGDGALAVLYAAALDTALADLWLDAAPRDPHRLPEEPLDRNLFGWLPDASVARLIDPRPVHWNTLPPGTEPVKPPLQLPDRRHENLTSLVDTLDRLVRQAERYRDTHFRASSETRRSLHDEVFGRLPLPATSASAQTRRAASGEGYSSYEVRLPIEAGLFAWGILLKPDPPPPGRRLPVVVLQHGLLGRPQHLFGQPPGREFDVYGNYAEKLVRAGFLVYLPQNPYIHDFRPIARMANPLGLSLFSFILAQYERMLSWLASLPEADPERIGFYGLSYGGKTALRAGPLFPQFRAVVCAGDFNEWIRKLVTLEEPYSYVFTGEYEILEWNLAWVASHAEMAMLVAPRPLLVERGHRDGVGRDEWVSYEFAKVRRFYSENGWPERTGIAFFNGPHRIDGTAALEFLRRWLNP